MDGQELYNQYHRYYNEFETDVDTWDELTDEDRIVWEKLAEFAWSYRE